MHCLERLLVVLKGREPTPGKTAEVLQVARSRRPSHDWALRELDVVMLQCRVSLAVKAVPREGQAGLRQQAEARTVAAFGLGERL